MSRILSSNILYDLDMVRLDSGEVLTIYGNYSEPWYRARLSFYQSEGSRYRIAGQTYAKVTYETGHQIPHCRKVLDLPGEQHFLVPQSRIIDRYEPVRAFEGLSSGILEDCKSLIAILKNQCGIAPNQHGLTGSGALRSMRSTSDLDWIIYGRYSACVKDCLTSDPRFQREPPFSMEHVHRKYGVFSGLSRSSLDALFAERWKYIRFCNHLISLSFVDPFLRADDFLVDVRIGKRITMEATVVKGAGCYHTPRIFPISYRGKRFNVLTWLFLYNGAFNDGDIVEVSGCMCEVSGNEYILVESPQDYIKNITVEQRRIKPCGV